MKLELEITKATVLRSDYGPDKIYFETTLKEATWPYTGKVTLSFDAAAGYGEEFFKSNFPNIDYVVKDLRGTPLVKE